MLTISILFHFEIVLFKLIIIVIIAKMQNSSAGCIECKKMQFINIVIIIQCNLFLAKYFALFNISGCCKIEGATPLDIHGLR